MAHARRNPNNPTSERDSPTPRGRESVSQQQTPQGDEEPAPPPNPPGGPDDEGNPPEGPGGPPPGPPPPNPPAPPPPPPPAAALPAVAPPAVPSKKSHIKKPDDFDDSKYWDCYKQQTFVYIQENKKDFASGESVVRFLLSFMTGGLPEKFAANFIDDLMEYYEQRKRIALPGDPDPVVNWGTADEFYEKCEETFGDQNKKSNAEHQLSILRQGNKTAEEYFQEFDQLVRTAKYHVGHDDVLIKYLLEQVKSSVIDKLYAVGKLPRYYQDWKEAILNIDGLERQRDEQKKFISTQHFNPTPRANPPPRAPTERRTTPAPQMTDQAPKVELDVAKAKGLCFRCGKPRHMSRNCPDRGKFQVHSLVNELTDEEKKEAMEALKKEGF
jgi:hypothetical protein